MKSTEIERLIKSDILSIENRVRHAFNQGFDFGYKEGIGKSEKAIEFSEEDAIKMLKSKMDGHTDTSYEWAETVRMSIKALEQEPCDNAVSRQDVLDLAKKGVLVSNGNYESVCKAINELPSVNPQPCEDAIDRAEAIKIASGYCHPANVAKELAKLPSVNPMPCEDAISRQAVLDMATTIQTDDYSGNEIIEVVDVDDVKALPPVTPQLKTGHWIKRPQGFKCSKCLIIHSHTSIFCPSCGAKMIEPQESERTL